jgi:hypothetical protein
MKVDWINEKEALEKLIKEGVPYERIGRQYDVSGTAVKKAAKKLGIELEQKREINPNEHFNKGVKQTHICLNCGKEFEHRYTSNNKFCSIACQRKYEYNEYIKRWKNGEEDGIKGKYDTSSYIRKYLFEKYDGKCQICGWNEENPITHKVPLQIHHIDGNCLNNNEENLQLLCPNHHSLTETFGKLNESSKRVFRRQKEKT